MSDTPMPQINTHVRLFDLVRYSRSSLHKDGLITDEEYAWLCADAPMATSPSGGSPSPRRLEDYDKLRRDLAAVTKERDSLDKRHAMLISDWCEIDTKIRELAILSQVPKDVIDGDSYHVPGPQEILELIEAKHTEALVRIKRLEEAGDALVKLLNDDEDNSSLMEWMEKANDVEARWVKAKEAR